MNPWNWLHAAPLNRQRKIQHLAATGGNRRHHDLVLANTDLKQIHRKITLKIIDSDSQSPGGSGKQIGRREQTKFETMQVKVSAEPGNRHKAKQSRNQQIEQIIAGINGSKSEQQGQGNIKSAGSGQP